MAANKLRLASCRLFLNYFANNSQKLPSRVPYCTDKTEETSENVGRFAQFYEKELELQRKIASPKEPVEHDETFAALLRKSKFIDLGDPEGKEVIGEIYHVVGNDLYIDFGWKFPTVCPIPRNNASSYIKGAKVKLLIKELEISTKFLGSVFETTLLEADCVLLGLLKDRKSVQK